MATDNDTIDQVPPAPVLPPGSGFTYSTQGPGDFSTTRMMGGPGGVQVPVPVNAQNFSAVQGAPGPVADPQTEILRNVFNKLPVEQAIKAVQAAHMYQGQRLYQRMLSEGKTSAEALTVAGPLLFGGGINPTELAKFAAIGQGPPKPVRYGETGQGGFQLGNRLYPDKAPPKPPKPPTPPKEGSMTQQQVHEFQMLSTAKAGLEKSLAELKNEPEQLKKAQDKITEIDDRQNELIGKPKKATVTGKAPKVGDVVKGYRFKGGDPSKKTNWEKVE